MYDIDSRVLHNQRSVVMRTRLTVDDIADWLGMAYPTTAAAAGSAICGPPFARYTMIGDDAQEFDVEAGFPVSEPVEVSGEVEVGSLPGGPAAVTWHVGPYDAMKPAYVRLLSWIKEHGAVPDGSAWEVYHSDPAEEPDPATWRTEIVQPYTV